jgi:hypothetical protein
VSFAVVKGLALRASKIDRCGKPLAGASNRLVTEGFIRVNLDPELKAAEDLEQTNAAGKVCVQGRTPPERKWWNVEIQFCDVDPDLYSLITGWARVLDWDDNPIGFRDQKEVNADTGVAFEVWTGVGDDDGCEIPLDDSIFSAAASGASHGYLLFGGTEFISGALTVESGVATFTMTGRTIAMPHWGRGPYNVAATDASGTPGRLLVPTSKSEHITLFSTPVVPPEVTDGADALAIQTLFAAPPYYYGASSADVAPEQAAEDQGYNVTITGVPTGGNWSSMVTYPGGETLETGVILFNSTPGQLLTILAALDDGYTASDWTVTGTNLPAGTINVIPPDGVTFEPEDNGLTGGTTPAAHVTAV